MYYEVGHPCARIGTIPRGPDDGLTGGLSIDYNDAAFQELSAQPGALIQADEVDAMFAYVMC